LIRARSKLTLSFVWDRGGMRRMLAGSAVVVGVLATTAPPAGAKGLPIASVSVSTATPTVGEPFTVTVRFRPGLDYIDAGWEDFEIFLLSAARTDAQGWPLVPGEQGKSIPIRRVGFGVFRGGAVVHTPGEYVLLDTSSLSAHIQRAQHFAIINGGDASPVRVNVVAPARASHTTTWLVVGAGAFLLAGAIVTTRRRRRSASEPEELAPPVSRWADGYAGR
jgi:hypothetical protein